MSIAIDIKFEGMDAAIATMEKLAGFEKTELLESIGGLVESQTKRRIMSEKTAPDGSAWADNNSDNPIMHQSGALHDDIAFQVEGDTVFTGSSLPYAGQRHFGGVIKAKDAPKLVFKIGNKTIMVDQVEQPSREFLGLSPENATEVEQLTADFIEAIFQ